MTPRVEDVIWRSHGAVPRPVRGVAVRTRRRCVVDGDAEVDVEFGGDLAVGGRVGGGLGGGAGVDVEGGAGEEGVDVGLGGEV